MRFLLYIALFIGVFTYMLWPHFPKGTFYVGNALFIFLICTYLFYLNKNIFIKFILFSLSLNNLLDELCFDPENLGLNELLFVLFIPIVWFIKFKKK